jgi:hypothetical protein
MDKPSWEGHGASFPEASQAQQTDAGVIGLGLSLDGPHGPAVFTDNLAYRPNT